MSDKSPGKDLGVADIVQMASAFYSSAVLFAALEIDLFTVIQQLDKEATADQIALQSGKNLRGTTLLLNACAALGLLHKSQGVYTLNKSVAATLTKNAPHDLTRAIRYNQDVYPAWGRLTELVQDGKPVEAPELHLGGDVERTRNFVLSMHGRALGIGRAVVPMLDLTGCSRLLDLAGGPGTYAMLLAQANPGLSCVTVDLAPVSAVAAELVAEAGMSDRVQCVAGSYHTATYEPESYDAVTIFGALHQESPSMIVHILKQAYNSLKPGGRIFILDMMCDESHTKPAFSALFAINMALTTHHGWVFSDTELYGWLHEAGFTDCTTREAEPPMPHWLVSALKV